MSWISILEEGLNMPKKFTVAVEGKTIDGRELTKAQLTSAAKNYDPKTRMARVNVSHIMGFSPEPPFNAYGDVLSLETKTIELNISGKKESRLALVAEIEPNQQLLEINKKGQKLYTSIELWGNFQGKADDWYMGGLAVTDDPASFGTDRLEFSAFPTAPLKSEAQEIKFEDAEAAKTNDNGAISAFTAMVDILKSAFQKEDPKNPNAETNKSEFDLDAFAQTFSSTMEKFSSSVATSMTALEAKIETVSAENKKTSEDLATLTTKLESQTSGTYTPRPAGTGGDIIRATC